jgi:hypothetical protein
MALDTNLLAYWKMENVNDAFGSRTLTNNNTVTFVSGKVNNAGSFNGSNYLSRASDSGLQITGAMTIGFWVYLNNLTGTQVVVAKSNGNISNYEYEISVGSSGQLAFTSSNPVNYFNAYTANSVISASTWYYVICRRTGNTIGVDTVDFRVNGTNYTTSVGSGSIALVGTSTTDFTIGKRGGTPLYLDGKIDELAIWTRVLSDSEFDTLYNSGSGMTYPFGTAYTIAIVKGAYTLTGIATAFRRALNILITRGTYVYTGIATAFKLGKGFQAISGSYILTGNNALFGKVISMLIASGSYTYTGFATGLAKTKLLIASVGNYIYNGIATGISHGRKITITKGTYTYTGIAVAVHRGVVLMAVTGTYVLHGFKIRMSIYWKNTTKNVVSWVNEKKSNV